MKNEPTRYAPSSLETARTRLRTLFDRFRDATGYPPTLVGLIARGEPKWARQFEERDFTHQSYDTAVSSLSALWPDDVVPWPEDVPRQAPAMPPAEIIAKLEARAARAEPTPPELPHGAAWPQDIPQPGQTPTTEPEGGSQHGEEAQGR